MTSFYHRHISPRMINLICGAPMISKQRAKVVPAAEGRVLEVGFGSGTNLPFYDPSKVEHLFALEPDPHMRKLAKKRLEAHPLKSMEFLDLPGEEIPLEDASVDTVVVTYTMCTIPDVDAAAGQMRRVIKPGGKLLFVEHGRDCDPRAARFQERIEPIWKPLADGCHLTRNPAQTLFNAGFVVSHEEGLPSGAPIMTTLMRFGAYHYWGSAKPA
ncbi:MAG: class I SAM-dependent methyltransferase [Maricaulaceae bacterium]|jgi:SAM-dependent methyltransferase